MLAQNYTRIRRHYGILRRDSIYRSHKQFFFFIYNLIRLYLIGPLKTCTYKRIYTLKRKNLFGDGGIMSFYIFNKKKSFRGISYTYTYKYNLYKKISVM